MRYTPDTFEQLVDAWLASGFGISGIQPKVMLQAQLPDRASIAVPSLIVKAGSPAYPHIAANEFLCLKAARAAGIEVPTFDLSDDGQLLVLDRFDIRPEGDRLGFEDIAALMGRSVRDTLSDRKYTGSYEQVAEVLKAINVGADDLARFFAQVAFTVMVRNGDGHLKNFGVLYEEGPQGMRVRLSPMYDVLTTSIYRYVRYPGGPELEDRTLALKLLRGKKGSKVYPMTEELLAFGRRVCGVRDPGAVLQRIAAGMQATLAQARGDDRIPAALLDEMAPVWEHGCSHAREAAKQAAVPQERGGRARR
jgi:serine/threonine-protein kinase HipA